MKKKTLWIVLAVIILVAAGYFAKTAKQAVAVETSAVVKGDIAKYVEETATAKLADQTAIYALRTGRVAEVKAEVGQQVKAGDLLVRMDDSEVLLQLKDLNAQKLAVEAQYAEARTPAKDAEIVKLNAQVKSAQVNYDEARQTVEDNKALLEQGAISQAEYQTALSRLTAMEAALEAARSNFTLAQNGISANVRKQYGAQLSEIQSRIDLLEKQRQDLNIVAPADGIILTRDVELGSFTQAGKLLMEMGGKADLHLQCDVLVDDIANIKEGASVIIVNEDLGIKDLRGRVTKIYPSAFTKVSELGIAQKRVTVEISIQGDTTFLKPEYDVTAKMVVQEKKDTLLMDKKALFDYQGKDAVFAVDKGVARLKPVEKGIEGDEQVEIIKGLNAGEQVILSPDKSISDGMKVK